MGGESMNPEPQPCSHDWRLDERGAPVVPPIWVCTRCGKFERATNG